MNVTDLNPEWDDLRRMAQLIDRLTDQLKQRDETILELRAELQRLQQLANY